MENIYYYHGTMYPHRKGYYPLVIRFTIAGQYDQFKDNLQLGIAICSHKDNFCKAIGRKIAIDKLERLPFTIELHKEHMYSNNKLYKPFAEYMYDHVGLHEGLIFNQICKSINTYFYDKSIREIKKYFNGEMDIDLPFNINK